MKTKNIIIIVVVTLLVLIGGLLIYKAINSDRRVSVPVDLPYDKSLNLEDTTLYYYSYEVRLDAYDDSTFCQFDSCGSLAAEFKTETDEIEILDVYKTKYLFYKDNGRIKVYNNDEKKSYVINVKGDGEVYLFGVDEETDEFYGVIVDKDNLRYYFSIEKNDTLYAGQYKDLYFVSSDYLSASVYETIVDEEDGYEEDLQKELLLLSTDKEKIVIKQENADNEASLLFDVVISGGKKFYVLESLNVDSSFYKEVYDKNFKSLFKSKRNNKYEDVSERFVFDCTIHDGYIYVFDDGVLYRYDSNGKLVKKSKKYYGVQMIAGEYMVITNTNLLLTNIDGKEVKLSNWNNEKYLHTALSGWYEENNKKGIYLVVEEDNVNIDEVWKKCLEAGDCEEMSKEDLADYNLGYEYYYIPTTGETGKIATYIGGYAKPVLYLYPTSKTNVTVTFDKPDNLTTTYPKYKGSWEVTAYPNGDLYDKDNKYYYGLYWEEKLNHRVNFNEGFYVTKDNAIEFLEEKLTYIGLNDKERNEFIMYWLPILEKNGKNLVYFELTEERNMTSKINISPSVDSMLRIAIHVKKVNSEVKIKEEKLTRFNRVGFSAVEWGGVMY